MFEKAYTPGTKMIVRNTRELGGLLRQAREDAGLTQAELAQRLTTRRQQVILLERGEGQIALSFVFAVLRELAFDLDVRTAGEGKRQRSRSAVIDEAPYSIDDIAEGKPARTRT